MFTAAAGGFGVKVAVRVDASRAIGSGHVMRCLALAGALRARGAQVHFISRAHDRRLAGLIRGEGHACSVLESPPGGEMNEPGPSPYAAWLGVSWRLDAEQTQAILERESCEWLVVDHYALDWRWESALRPAVGSVMVVDDLSDRRHDCDVLLNPVYGSRAEDCRRLTPPGCRLLLGPEYAPLRPEFAERRAAALERRRGSAEQAAEPRRLLIAFGGVDADNLTARTLARLAGMADDLPAGAEMDVVLGAGFSGGDEIRRQAAAAPVKTEVAVGVDNMAERTERADLGVGAAGVSAWERCCLGLPSVAVVTAENQKPNAEALREQQVSEVVLAENFDRDFYPALLRAMRDRTWRRQAALRAARLCDGRGAERVAAAVAGE